MRWWGWGDPAHAAGAAGARAGVPARDASGSPSARARRSRSSRSRSRRARCRERRSRALRGIVRHRARPRRARRTRAARGRQGLPRPRAPARGRAGGGAGRGRATRLRTTSCARVLALCASSSLAVVPFGGGTSVVGGVAPLRGAHAGVLALDMSRIGGRAGARPRVGDGHGQGGHPRPGARAPPGRARAHAGALPAVLRVRLAGRLRGDALGRAGLQRLRRDREDGARPAPGGAGRRDIELPALPASAAGPGLRQLLVGSEGTLGRDLQSSRCACARRRASASTRASSSRTSPPAPRRCARSRASTCCPTSRASPTSRRRACRWRSRARAA